MVIGPNPKPVGTLQALALPTRIVLACAERPDEAHGVLARELGVHRAALPAPG